MDFNPYRASDSIQQSDRLSPENHLNYLDLVSDKIPGDKRVTTPVPDPTRADLMGLLDTAPGMGPMAREIYGKQIQLMDKEDFHAIGEITRALQNQDYARIDDVLKPFACTGNRTRDLINSLNLWLEHEGMSDQFDAKYVGLDGANVGDGLKIHKPGDPRALYTFRIDETCG